MKIICDKCEWVIDKDKYVDGELVEEYKNVFGTTCPNCWHTIKPFKKPFSDKKRDDKMEILREEMRDKLRKNIKGEK
jgi:hypothetical protein